MSTSAEKLQVLENDIKVPGCTFTRTGLVLEIVSEETLIHAGTFLAEVEGCRSWWWGDYLVAYCEFRLAQEASALRDEARRDPAVRVRMFRRYTAEREEVARADAKTLHVWRDTSEFYKLARRRAELSNSHHQEAMAAADGDASVADDWLDLATANRWTVPQMRAAIRLAKIKSDEPDEPTPTIHQQELFACARWARVTKKRVDDMDRSEAEALLRELEPILALAALLAARIATAGKESFNPSRAA